MITVNGLSMLFGDRLLFDEVSLNLLPNNRYGVVGANGAGKSTFLKLLAGEEEPSLGEVLTPRGATLGWLRQDHFQYEANTVQDVVIRGQEALWQAWQEKDKLLEADIWNEETGGRLGELEEIVLQYDGYTAHTLAQKLLLGVGVGAEYHEQPLSILSGGYKLRVLLAQALFQQPDILLLDEPTNHLDLPSIAWLESYLTQEFRGVLVFISHDEAFLSNLSTHILDIDYADIRLYPESYAKFHATKQALAEQKEGIRQNLEKKRAHLETFVKRFGAKASKATQAKSKQKQIDKIQLPDLEASSRVCPRFHFSPQRSSGKAVLTVEGLSKSFDERRVLNQVSFQVKRGERVVLIGANGMGKLTLLKSILGLIPMDAGELTWGHGVSHSYFAQDHHELLQDNSSLYEWLSSQSSGMSDGTQNQVRTVLGQMLFTKDEVHKSILSLSGGESARLLLGRVMLEKANLLILDEPTNHLDMEAIQALAEALKKYTGTVLFVSHNRKFVSQVATHVLAITPKGIRDYPGKYKDYLAQHGQDFLSRS